MPYARKLLSFNGGSEREERREALRGLVRKKIRDWEDRRNGKCGRSFICVPTQLSGMCSGVALAFALQYPSTLVPPGRGSHPLSAPPPLLITHSRLLPSPSPVPLSPILSSPPGFKAATELDCSHVKNWADCAFVRRSKPVVTTAGVTSHNSCSKVSTQLECETCMTKF